MDSISSSILGPICERVINAAFEEYKLVRNVKEEIKNLCKTVSMIQGVLDDAERKQVENGRDIRDWLKSLKQVLYDAEDILDEIATDEALQRRDADGTCRSITRRLSKVRKLISCLCSVSTRHDVAHQIKDIEKKFDDISKLKDSFGLRVPDENSWSVIRTTRRQQETCSLLPREAHIIGRDDEMQKIEKLVLLESAEGTSDNKNVHVISVVGMGGVGKTTLVQHVYNNPAVTEYFQLRMWVCVSNDFDLKRITREIMDAASSSEKAKEIINDNSNWDAAQKSLQGKLEGKRFLLVLDDVWEEDPLKWDNLCIPLMYGGKGSIIIVTTRSQKVSNITKAGTSAIFLKDLSSKDLWTVFKNYAFDGHDPNKHTELVDVGGQIVEKLKGSPLAAKTIGRLLNSNLDVEHWTNILKSEAWVSSHHENSILPILQLSYDHLPGHLKQCFAYCSLFPEDHVFYKYELVQLWTAQQFIRPTREVSHLESAGGEYFDNLVYMSLFEKQTYNEEAYVMHDLIHNLAESVSDGDCLRLEDNQQKRIMTSETIRHVSIASGRFDPIKIIEEVCKYENTRTLLFLRGWQSQLDPDHLHNMFMKLQRLRVLGLSGCNFRKLPASIGTLKHLRLLDLSYNESLIKLPETLCELHNLQVLKLEYCGSIVALPRNMSALINLRHLMTTNHELVSSIQGLGKLTALHELRFDCGRQPMKELADMGMLRRLEIRGLEKVESWEEAIDSRLDKKEHLDELTLEWDHGWFDVVINPGLEVVVLESLRPPSSIRELSIYGYGGTRSPSWMEEQVVISLPPRQQHHPPFLARLRKLTIQNCPKLRQLPPLPPTLTELEISNLPGWLPSSSPACSSSSSYLQIDNCPNNDQLDGESLSTSLRGLTSLRRLSISECPAITSLPRAEALSHLTALEILQISRLKALRSFGGGIHCLASLEALIIEDCPELLDIIAADSSPSSSLLPSPAGVGTTRIRTLRIRESSPQQMKTWLLQCPSLQDLSIWDCPQLKGFCGDDGGDVGGELEAALLNLSTTLQHLEFWECENLRSLPPRLRCLSSLKSLQIHDCPQIRCLPVAGLPESLQSLIILECPALKERCEKGDGPDWPLISHIPGLNIW